MIGGFFSAIGNVGKGIERAAGAFFGDDSAGDALGLEDAGDELVIDAGGDFTQEKKLRGEGYELSYMYYKNRDLHTQPYFLTTQLGAPFPSYHAAPLPDFPPRWTCIPGIKMPCESIIAPRIRLAPREFTEKLRDKMTRMRETATNESWQPKTTVLNLCHQALGDPYQYEAMVTFIDLNRSVRILNLNDNDLDDISDLILPNAVKLHASHNSFISFYAIPELPECQELYLTNNFISGMAGLTSSRFPKLRVLHVHHNPIQHMDEYRKLIAESIPTLEVLDGERV